MAGFSNGGFTAKVLRPGKAALKRTHSKRVAKFEWIISISMSD